MRAILRQPLARQGLLIALAVSSLVFGALIAIYSVLSRQAALDEAKHSLTQVGQVSAALFEQAASAQRDRSTRLARLAENALGGKIAVDGKAPDGAPRVKAGAVELNGNSAALEKVRSAFEADMAVLGVRDGHVVRLASLLKDASGKSMQGTPIDDNDPVARAVRDGKTAFSTIERSGTLYFSFVQPIEGAQGQAAISFRLPLKADFDALSENLGKIKIADTG